ncbi:MAG: large-conductance mechanosensitive channel protein MscL [Prevotella sp.]|nr:large-conductance mechanosensitive channel protein MscL [Prevotella sp.]
MSNFIKEFKEFAVKGNAIDMAVGVIIGGAFGEIVNSIVNDIIMPPIGWLIGGVNFSDLKVELPKVVLDSGIELAPATINYGSFVQTIINFIIIALCVFMMIKGLAKLKNSKEAEAEAPAAPAEPSNEEKLLTEIRDLLAKK